MEKGINPRNSKLARAAAGIAELAPVFLQEAVDCSVGSRGLAGRARSGNESVMCDEITFSSCSLSCSISRQGKTWTRTEGSTAPAGAVGLLSCQAPPGFGIGH